jgi:hypothetical protein
MTNFFNRLLEIMRFTMPLLYLVIGLLMTFTKFLGEETGKVRVTLGILLIAYSLFRGWRLIKDRENLRENETSTD